MARNSPSAPSFRAEYTQEVAAYFDQLPPEHPERRMTTVDAHKVAILAGLAVTDELFQARRGDTEMAGRITIAGGGADPACPGPSRRGPGGRRLTTLAAPARRRVGR